MCNQIKLMESYLNKTIFHKIKDNFKTCSSIKNLLQKYISYLNNEMFQTTKDIKSGGLLYEY